MRLFFYVLVVLVVSTACWEAPLEPSATQLESPAPDAQLALHGGSSRVVASATGSGHRVRNDQPVVFTFNAIRRADGTSQGRYYLDWKELGGGLGRLQVEVDVTCMSVRDNIAWVGGIITKVDGPLALEGTVSYFYVIDNGEGADAVDEISQLRLNDVAGEDQVFCDEQPLVLLTAPIERGNAKVRSF